MDSKKEIRLSPSHATLFWRYIVAILLTPVFGIGLYLIYRNFKTISSTTYIIRDESIKSVDSKYTSKVDLVNIVDVKAAERRTDQLFNIGDIILKTNSREIRLIGIKHPHNLADMIKSAAEIQRERQEKLSSINQKEQKFNPGTLDKLDYLTGLWQQGLLSDEDYLQEKKHFDQ